MIAKTIRMNLTIPANRISETSFPKTIFVAVLKKALIILFTKSDPKTAHKPTVITRVISNNCGSGITGKYREAIIVIGLWQRKTPREFLPIFETNGIGLFGTITSIVNMAANEIRNALIRSNTSVMLSYGSIVRLSTVNANLLYAKIPNPVAIMANKSD